MSFEKGTLSLSLSLQLSLFLQKHLLIKLNSWTKTVSSWCHLVFNSGTKLFNPSGARIDLLKTSVCVPENCYQNFCIKFGLIWLKLQLKKFSKRWVYSCVFKLIRVGCYLEHLIWVNTPLYSCGEPSTMNYYQPDNLICR